MENKKLIILLSSLVIIFGLGFVGVMIYLLGLKSGQKAIGQNPGTESSGGEMYDTGQGLTSGESMYVAEKEKQPEVMTGKIDSVEDEKLVLKQIASIDLRYEIEKKDVGEIIMMKKNPSFNQEKAQKAQEEMMKLFPPAPAGSTPPTPVSGQIANNNSTVVQPEIPAEARKKIAEFENDPELRMFDEIKASWSDIEKGMQVNLITEQDGKRKLTIFSEDFPMGSMDGESVTVPENSDSIKSSLTNPNPQ